MREDQVPFGQDGSTGKIIRVLIADDFKLLRDVIRLYLERAEDISVVDEALELNEALARTKALVPDVIIMNDYLPPIDSARAASLFREHGVSAAILVISLHPEFDLIQHSFRSGIDGFLHKDEIDDYLVDAVRRVYHGERYLSPKAADIYNSIQE
jgi:two-component system, NarL family, invasion response regulator UvrY